jgi:hypothetical protein
MITSSQIIISLNEVWVNGLDGRHEVLENPTKKELREIDNIIRFSADAKTKTVYAWGAYENMHPLVRIALDIKCPQPIGNQWCSTILEGIAHRRGDKYHMTETDAPFMDMINFPNKYKETWFTIDWSWVDKYIIVTPWVNTIKEMYLEKK